MISNGKVQEWLNWLVSKTSVPHGTEGSNPSLSAKNIAMSIEQPKKITVVTQNILLDVTRTGKKLVYSQNDRIDAMAASFLDSGLPLDIVGIQEAHYDQETGRHNGEMLAQACGFADSYWEQHNEKPYEGSPTGRSGEHVGLFGSLVNHTEAIDLGDRRKALVTVIADVAFVTFHWRARSNMQARQSRKESAKMLVEVLNTYDDAVVFGDFNESHLPLIAPGREILARAGFKSVFASMQAPQPKTFPTESYRGITSEAVGTWSLDDIMTRGDRVRVLGAGTIAQVAMDTIPDDQDIRPIYPSDHLGLWAQLGITSE